MSTRHGLVLGVDAGGTKTDAALADAGSGELVASVRVGPANHERVGWAGSAEALHEALGYVCEEAGVPATAVTAAAWGLAGLDWPDDEVRYRRIITSLGLTGPLVVVNDAFLALEPVRAESRSAGSALAVVSGTGMVAVGRDASGRTVRTLGVGAGHGEWGSGGDVVKAAAEAVAQAHLGLGSATALTEAALTASGADNVEDYCRLVWREQRPALTPADVWDVAADGDNVAGAIAARAADSYAAAAASLVSRLKLTEPPLVILAGRVLDPGHIHLNHATIRAIHRKIPGSHVRRMGVPPVVGAIQLARRAARAGA